jgi:hypothetical protein
MMNDVLTALRFAGTAYIVAVVISLLIVIIIILLHKIMSKGDD